MASGVNKVILVGNLGKEPEVRYIQSGQAVCTLRLAITERRKDGDEWKDVTEWMDVVCWGKTAENAGQYLAKGRQVYVEGRMQTRQYKDKEGHDRYKTEVVAAQVLFLGGQGAGNGAGAAQGDRSGGSERRPAGDGGSSDSSGSGAQSAPKPDAFDDSDLPFVHEAAGLDP